MIVVALKGLILHEGQALLLRRSDTDETGPGTWEFPGGKLEFGEKLEDALAREIEEETGLRTAAGELLYAATFLTNPERQVVLLTYACRIIGDFMPVALSPEHSGYRWVSPEEFGDWLPAPILAELASSEAARRLGFG
ncbi:NUDIX hydrolase [Paenibacillus glufosinatiresistens]|uniref:NUDIX hydrolase n=1 Tax=Paenibacillus glufosinatiresistens TaxID=3070657 RepID=UPI00286D8F02|nr:NUDIX domain-containing protein [Paenibacillus sp. YX.27]